jgi:phage terminase large subunit
MAGQSTRQSQSPSSKPAKAAIKAEFPEKLAPLFEPHPYKVIYGGRDGVKSWSVARALLILGAQKPLRILCARETMDSIRESVHQLLTDQIVNLGLEDFYTPLQSEVRGANGTEFVFAGLRKQTVSSIKSYEAIDICWIEEASVVSRRSLTILLPTIRKPGSEIWLTLNPDLETDAVYQDFILNPPKGAFVCKTSFRDNNWLSPESRQKIETLRERDFDTYHHVYEGATRSTVEGAIYKAEIQVAEKEGRIREVKFDPMLPVDTFWDLGFADRVAIWAAQRTSFEIRVLRYFEDDHQAIDYYLREMQTWGYVFGTCFLPWDGGTKQLGTGRSIEEIMRTKGFRVQVNRQLNVADGINAVRTIFPQLYFDSANCADGLQYLRRYQWGPATALGVPRSTPLHDDASHPADALRTLAVGIKEPLGKPKASQIPPVWLGTSSGWMA